MDLITCSLAHNDGFLVMLILMIYNGICWFWLSIYCYYVLMLWWQRMCFDDSIVFDEIWSYGIYNWWMDIYFFCMLSWGIVKYALLAFNDIKKGRNTWSLRSWRIWELKYHIRYLMSLVVFIYKMWLIIMELEYLIICMPIW